MIIEKLLSLFGTAPSFCEHNFLTLISWYHYLPDSDFQRPNGAASCDIRNFNLGIPGNGKPSDIPLVLAAVIDDLLQIAGLVALGFVIYGAIKYIASQGNPESAANAQSTIINALIGLAIAITGVAFINFIGTHVG